MHFWTVFDTHLLFWTVVVTKPHCGQWWTHTNISVLSRTLTCIYGQVDTYLHFYAVVDTHLHFGKWKTLSCISTVLGQWLIQTYVYPRQLALGQWWTVDPHLYIWTVDDLYNSFLPSWPASSTAIPGQWKIVIFILRQWWISTLLPSLSVITYYSTKSAVDTTVNLDWGRHPLPFHLCMLLQYKFSGGHKLGQSGYPFSFNPCMLLQYKVSGGHNCTSLGGHLISFHLCRL